MPTNFFAAAVAKNTNITMGNKTWMLFPNARVSQSDAITACDSLGGLLLSIDSDQQNAVLMSELAQWNARMWIGLNTVNGQRSSNRADWVWMSTDAAPIWTNWDGVEPNNYNGNEGLCVVAANYLPSAGWNDVSCSSQAGYGCQVLI